MKSGVSPQKTPIWASICNPVAPSLLISLEYRPHLGGHNFRLGGTSSHLGGHGPGMPPVAPGLASLTTSHILSVIYISFYSLTSRTRINAVELIIRKYLLLWWSFCVLEVTYYSHNFKIKINTNALRSCDQKSFKIANSDN